MDRHHRSTKHPGMSPDPLAHARRVLIQNGKDEWLMLHSGALKNLSTEARQTLYASYDDLIHSELANAELVRVYTALMDLVCPEKVLVSPPDEPEEAEDLDPDERDLWARRTHARQPPESDPPAPRQRQAARNPAPWWPCCRREV